MQNQREKFMLKVLQISKITQNFEVKLKSTQILKSYFFFVSCSTWNWYRNMKHKSFIDNKNVKMKLVEKLSFWENFEIGF